MKSILLIIMFTMLMLVPTVSALEFDNRGDYDSVNKKVTITNAFGFGDTIAEITLDTPLLVQVIYGEERLVAEMTVELFDEEYKEFSKNMQLKNLKNNAGVKRDTVFKKKIVTYVNESYYEGGCIDNNNYNTCSRGGEIIYEKEVITWEKLKPKDLKQGKVTLGLFADVKRGDYVDWVPTFMGVEIPEWAAWEESWSVGMVGYYPIDEGTGTTTENIFTGLFNGTITVGTGGVWNLTEFMVLNSYQFAGVDTEIRMSGSEQLGHQSNLTYSFWLFPTAAGCSPNDYDTILMTGADQTNSMLIDFVAQTCELRAHFAGGGGQLLSGDNANVGVWNHIVITHQAGGDTKMYLNGTEIATATGKEWTNGTFVDFGQDIDDSGDMTGLFDEIGIWNRSLSPTEISDIYDNGIGSFFRGAESPTVVLNSPDSNINFTVSPTTVQFNCSATDDANLLNLSLIVNGTINETVTNTTSSQTSLNLTKSIAFIDGNHNWACTATDGDPLTTTTANNTFIVHTVPSMIDVLEPNATINYHRVGDNLTLRWNITEEGVIVADHVANCSFTYNGVQTDLSKTTCIETNLTTFGYVLGIDNISMGVTDVFNFINNTDSNWSIRLIEINNTFNNITTEGSLEDYFATIRLRSGESIDEVQFIYNNTNFSGENFASGENIILRNVDFLPPLITQDTNFTYHWNVTLTNPTVINLSVQTQLVSDLSFDNCSGNNNTIFNFTMIDEELQTPLINTTLEFAFNLLTSDGDTLLFNLSELHTSTNPVGICMNINLSGSSNYLVDNIIRYEAVGYANEYYNIVGLGFTNNTPLQNIELFDLNISDSTEFQLTFTGSDFLPVENALVLVNRQYIAENVFKTVELPKTDSNGQTVLHLVRNNVIYNIQVTKDGVVLGSFNNLIAFCEDFTIGDCKINLNALTAQDDIFDYDTVLGITFLPPTYNSTNNLTSFTFLTTDGSIKTVLMNVTRFDIFGNSTVCESSLTSSGGTLSCTVPSNLEDAQLKISVFVDNILAVTRTIDIDEGDLGSAGYLIFFVMALSMILMFSGSKSGILFGMILSLAAATGFGIIRSDIIGVGASGIWLIVVLVIAVWKLNKENVQ